MSRFAKYLGLISITGAVAGIILYWLREEETKAQTDSFPPSRQTVDEHIIISSSVLPQEEEATEREDDLTQITGIGPKSAEALHQVGIRSYQSLARADADELLQKLSQIRGLNREKVVAWITQATELKS